jgi:autotransporter-associated beta strand protein
MKLSRFSSDWIAAILIGAGIVAGPGHAAAQRPLGIDVSSYQGDISWSEVNGAGISFAWAKATEGTFYIDPDFTQNEANAKANGVFIGAYHFAHPELDSADDEAAYFWNEAKNYIKGGGVYLVPMLDLEETSGGSTYMSDWVNEWCQDVVNYAKADGVTANPVVYTTGSIASDYLDSSVTQWPLWIADPNGENPETGGPTVSIGSWPTWTFWQYTWTGSVSGVGTCDEDVINGDATTLSYFVIGNAAPPSNIYYWDNNGGGGWSTGVAHWSTSSSGGSAIDWTDRKYAYFSAGSLLEGTGDITIGAAGLDTTGITIAQGTLSFNESQINLDSGPDKPNYCLINVASGLTATFNCTIGQNGTVGLYLDKGGGEVDLTAANGYNGSTYLADGTLGIGNNSALGGGAINFEGGSIKSTSSTARTVNNFVTLSQNTTFGGTGNLTFTGTVDDGGLSKTFTVNSGIAVEFDGVIQDGGADAGAVNTKSGAGTLVFTGANTYNKPTVLSAGTMAVGNNSALGVGAINFEGAAIQSAGSAAYTLGNAVTLSQNTTFGAPGTGNLTFNGAMNDGGASKTFTVNGITATFNGVISDGGADAGAVNTLAGDGTLVFTGANTYNKPTVISSGTMAVGNNSALGVGTINFGGGAIQSAGSAACTLANPITLSDDTTFGAPGTGNLTFNGAMDDGGSSKTFTVNGITATFNGVISDGGADAGAVNTLAGDGTLVFTGANTYNKPTVINSGTMAVGNNSALGVGTINFGGGAIQSAGSAACTLANAVTLSQNTTFGAPGTGNLTFSGPVDLGGAAKTCTVNGITLTFSGVISDTGGPSNPFMLTGGGTMVLSGVNTYVHITTVTSGTLDGNVSGSIPGNVTVNGGTLELGSASAMSAGATLTLASSPGAGAVNLNFAGTQTISALNFGSTSMAQGTWGASGAAHNNAAFTGGGLLNITSGGTSQTITFPNPGTQTYGVSPITLGASAPGGTVNYTVTSGPATVSGNQLTITGAGSVTVAANQAGNNTVNAAPQVSQTFTVNQANPNVTAWPTASAINYGQTLASSTLSGGAATPSGSFAFTTPSTSPAAGTAPQSVTYTPTDLTDYTTATSTVSVTVNQAALGVTANPQSKTYGTLLTFGSGSTNFTSSGLQNSETIGSVTLAVSGNGGATNAPVGTYIITPSAATGGTFLAGNYNITYNTNTLTVTLPSNTIPVTVTSVALLGNRTVQMNFAGTPGYVYLIEAATSLTSPIDWMTLSTNAADTNGFFNFIDVNAANFDELFYRTAAQ